MSVKVQALVWDHYPEGGGELLVALKVADHADHEGDRIWPGVRSLALLTRQSDRTVQRHLRAMVERGWLEVTKAGGGGPGQTTRYRIPVDRLLLQLAGKGDNLSPMQVWVTPATEKGDKSGAKGDIAVSPESSLKAITRNHQGSGRAAPGPVADLFHRYREGIARMYRAEYPGSASANGMLSQVVAKLGAARALQALDAYLSNRKPFYVQRKHALEVFAKDCTTLSLDAQQRETTGGRVPCAYCPRASIGSVNGFDHCREHQSRAMDCEEPTKPPITGGNSHAAL